MFIVEVSNLNLWFESFYDNDKLNIFKFYSLGGLYEKNNNYF